MKNFLLMAQSLGIFVIYLIVVFVLPAIKAFEFFNPAHIVGEDDVVTYFAVVSVLQAAIALVAIIIIMEKINV